MNKRNALVALCTAASTLDWKDTHRDIGPDLTIKPGEVAEIVVTSFVEDESMCGYSAVVRGGGILLIKLTPEGQTTRRNKAGVVLADDQRAKLLRLLDTWPTTACSLRRHAKSMGISLPEIKRACFQNPGRTPPPLRDEYERARVRWMAAYNARRAK